MTRFKVGDLVSYKGYPGDTGVIVGFTGQLIHVQWNEAGYSEEFEDEIELIVEAGNMPEFSLGDRVRHVDDGDGSFGEGEVISVGKNMIGVDWFNDSLDQKVPREDLELVEEQPNRTYYGETPTMEELNSDTGQTVFEVQSEPLPFATNVHRILDGVANTVIGKNASYGDSALNPIRVFSKSGRMEQLFVRLDDKLSRVQRGSEYPGDDTLRDIIGYATLILIARESE